MVKEEKCPIFCHINISPSENLDVTFLIKFDFFFFISFESKNLKDQGTENNKCATCVIFIFETLYI